MKLVIQLVLWVVIAALGYLLFNAVWGEVEFNEIKEKRYKAAITNMRDLRKAQLAHKTVTGKYEKDFDKLVRFIDTAEFTITQRRDTSVLDVEKTKRFRVDTKKNIVIIDTLGTKSVKDSLFKGSDRYKTMINVPIEGIDAKYTMDAGEIEKNNTMYPVFEISLKKDILLADQPKDYVAKEKQIVSVDGVNGDALTIGSMVSINTNSNFPKSYGVDD
ncbi:MULTISPECIES: hypothetical protein [unclassified Dokdonia]|jgi:hypothetical protein|uniref:hypothetical protein n=1 Tax=unclassified Dokdonia TaxID=2615033 RepID=UPI00020A6DFA|nr:MULTISPECIES: hypothetical protein [unclassified Dokdonia]AEE20772.1 hypothetical protein Krodi_2797 [Dokdonia sp. 4H-3-7-5]AWH75116.1 hypothetical protein DCS32_13365 [Dokdonia sp. Dokd-P16]|tara:strand:- start:13383 stop:14033 length:651 start_codon:yes stop_codon:yes gene_type:complete